MRHGWYIIPGVQTGDRTIEEQMLGIEPALTACRGKTVLELGAAECLMAAEFARAGAKHVTAIELLADHVTAGRKVCAGLPVAIIEAELAGYIEQNPQPQQHDIVLALGIAHKLKEPEKCLRFAARSARELMVFRGPGKATPGRASMWDGWLKAKFGEGKCHVPTLMAEEGFREGETYDSAHGERAQYWHRKAA